MTNRYYTPSGEPLTLARGSSASIRSEFNALQTAMGLVQGEIDSTQAYTSAYLLGVISTSSSLLTVGLTSQTLTVETGKGFAIGMPIKVASSASPDNYMQGNVTAYASSTGVLTFLPTSKGGSGAFSSWSVMLAAAVAPDNGGAQTTTSAVDVTLTSASKRVQAINMTASGMSVILPDATSLQAGGALFVIAATGYPLTIKDGAGTVLQSVGMGQKVMLFLSDTSTVAGVWAAGVFPYYGNTIAPTTANILNAVSSASTCVVALSATVAVSVSIESTFFQARVLTVSGGVVNAGAAVQFGLTAATQPVMTALSATKAMCVYTDSVGLKSIILDVSGTVVTPGTPQPVIAGATRAAFGLATLTTTKALCTYHLGSGSAYGVVLDVTGGTTVTPGTPQAFGAAIGVVPKVCALSSTKGLCVYYDQTNVLIQLIVLDVAGSTVSPGPVTTLTGYSGSGGAYAISASSATRALLVYRGTSTFSAAKVLDISGTTITQNSGADINILVTQLFSLTALSSTRFVMATTTSTAPTGRYSQVIDIVGTTPQAGPPQVVELVVGNEFTISALSSTKAIEVYPGGSQYLTANILGIGVSI